MARFLGKDSRVLVGPSSPPTTPVARVKDPAFDRTPTRADATTNDTGNGEEHDVVRVTGDLSFKMLTDFADPGQIILFNAATAGTKIFAELHPQGTASGRRFERFSCSVQVRNSLPINDLAATDVTLQPDGPVTTGTQ